MSNAHISKAVGSNLVGRHSICDATTEIYQESAYTGPTEKYPKCRQAQKHELTGLAIAPHAIWLAVVVTPFGSSSTTIVNGSATVPVPVAEQVASSPSAQTFSMVSSS